MPFSSRLLAALLDNFEHDPAAVFDATDAVLDAVPGVQSRHIVHIRNPIYKATERQLKWFVDYHVRLLLASDPEYPTPLCAIPDPPPFLFVRGSLSEVKASAVGIVGSRHATPYGRGVAERISRELAAAGLTVVSGGAVGIDTAAHRGAVLAGGRTVVVLGCGLDVDYPRENRDLFERVLENGALVSEYALGAQPEAWRFPLRNRIVSGMSQGIVVVEAPEKSGALITAHYAAEHGRVLMVVPANIDRPSGIGSNELLRDGAVPVLKTDHILEALNLVRLPSRTAHQTALDLVNEPTDAVEEYGDAPATKPVFPSLPPNQQRLLTILSQTPQHVDALAALTGTAVGDISVELIYLELDGLVRRLPGNNYIRTF